MAARQWRDYQSGTPGTMFADPDMSLTLDEAYKIQMEFAGLRCAAGDAVAGYKVGCIGSGVVEQFGMSGPIHARLFRSEIHNSGETLRFRA
jgi:2-keto-4-pentenoate hydratase